MEEQEDPQIQDKENELEKDEKNNGKLGNRIRIHFRIHESGKLDGKIGKYLILISEKPNTNPEI